MAGEGLTVEYKAISDLEPYAKNARTHSEKQTEQIAASIKEFGFTNPVLVDGKNGIIAGHGRVMAAKLLGMAQVPTIELQGLSEAQKRAYVLADNKLALNAGWDDALLAEELKALGEEGFDLSLTGFEDGLSGAFDNIEPLEEYPDLPSGEKEPFQQITFTLHDSQVEQVKSAMSAAASMGPFDKLVNENSNANAISRVCEFFLGAHGNS